MGSWSIHMTGEYQIVSLNSINENYHGMFMTARYHKFMNN